MAENEEFSSGGSQIHRYSPEDYRAEFGDLGDSSLEQIDEHIATHVGEVSSVLHEVTSANVHIDVHIVEPTARRDFYTLVTSGMSDKPMNSPEAEFAYSELVICLPKNWQLNERSISDERQYWPIWQLKYLARVPHEFKTWIWAAHTIPNGDPPMPFAENTQLCCALIAYPRLFGEGFWTLQVRSDKMIHFLSVIPIYKEEMEFKLTEGADALFDLFGSGGLTELLDINRPNYCI